MKVIDEVCPKANGVIRIVDASTLWIKTDKMSDDYIKRSDAIKALDTAWINGTRFLDANEAVKELNDLPSADTFEITKEALIEAIDNAETVGDVVENIIDRPTVNADMRADFLKRQHEAALKEIERLKADRPQKTCLKEAEILLKATRNLLNKQNESIYVLNMLEETVTYYGVECDGSCLIDDIDAWLELYGSEEGADDEQ